MPLTRMDAQSLYRAVERATGLRDFGDPYHREGLEVLLQSIDKDADLHFFVTGIPRSGTTFLHRMIAADPQNTGIPFRRLFRPFPTHAEKDSRQSTARFELKFRRPVYPEMDTKHFIREDQEEECIWMSGLTFQSIVFLGYRACLFLCGMEN